MKTHFVSKNLKSREADAIYEVQLKNKEKIYLYFLLEFQSYVDKLMALRLYIYTAMLYNELLSSDRIKEEIPIIIPIVFYIGDKTWTGSTNLTDLMDQEVLKIVKNYVPELKYMLIDKNRYTILDLKKMQDSISGILYLEKMTGEDVEKHLKEFGRLFLKGLKRENRTVLLEYIKYLVEYKFEKKINTEKLDVKEVKSMLADVFDKVAEKATQRGMKRGLQQGKRLGKQEGIQEGIQEGMQKGMQKVAKKMLDTGIDTATIAKVTGLKKTEINQLKRKKKS